jgi:beta-1,4-glucosyltransferase
MGDSRRGTLIVAAIATTSVLARPLQEAGTLTTEPLVWSASLWFAVALLHRRRSTLSIAQVKEAFAEAPAGLCFIDLGGRIRDCNVAFAQLLGREPGQLAGAPVGVTLGGPFWDAIREARLTLAAGTPLSLDGEVERPDGSRVWAAGHGRLVRNSLGEPACYALQLLDLTAQRDASRALAQVRSRYETIIDHSADLILTVDRRGCIIHANRRAAAVLRRSADQLTGTRLIELIDPRDRRTLFRCLANSLVKSGTMHSIDRLRVNLDDEVQVDARMVGLPDTPGIDGTIVTMRVITDWLASVARLRASETRFSRIFDASPDAILIVRYKDAAIVDFNPGFTRLLGYQRKEALGRSIVDLELWPRADQRASLLGELQSNGTLVDHASTMRTVAGKEVHVEVSARFIEIDGRTCVLCIGRDVTQRVLAEAALRDSEEKFERVFTHSPEGIVIIRSRDGVILDINPAFVRNSEFPREQLVGQSVGNLPIFANTNFVLQCATLLEQLNRPGMLIANDGLGMDIAARLAHGRPFPENLNGTDFVPPLLARIRRPAFLVGGAPGVAERAGERLRTTCGVPVVGVCDGFTGAWRWDLSHRINASGAEVVLVAMGNPQQEEWILSHRRFLEARLLIGVGALFDFLAGDKPRAPAVVRRIRLEWLYRLSLEPRRLLRRYTLDIIRFLARCWSHRGVGIEATRVWPTR